MNQTLSSQDVHEIKRQLDRIAAAVEAVAAKADPEYARQIADRDRRTEELEQQAKSKAHTRQQQPPQRPRSEWV